MLSNSATGSGLLLSWRSHTEAIGSPSPARHIEWERRFFFVGHALSLVLSAAWACLKPAPAAGQSKIPEGYPKVVAIRVVQIRWG